MRILLSEGIGDQVLTKLITAYRERSNKLYQILSLEPGIHFDTEPRGGYFAWVSFDGIDDTGEFLTFCSERGVCFLPGERCHVSEPIDSSSRDPDTQVMGCKKWARFCFADLDVDDLETGAHLVVQCYREYLNSS